MGEGDVGDKPSTEVAAFFVCCCFTVFSALSVVFVFSLLFDTVFPDAFFSGFEVLYSCVPVGISTSSSSNPSCFKEILHLKISVVEFPQ